MKLDKNGIDLIKRFEGFSAFPYKDEAGLLTIGYGHLIKPGESFERDISIEEAEILLRKDAAFAEKAVNENVDVEISQAMFNALVSLVYNIGVNAFLHINDGEPSTVLRKLNEGDYEGAKVAFLSWNKITIKTKDGKKKKVVSVGLSNRRNIEAGIFA